MCLVNGSAQTEQMAAMRSRLRVDPPLLAAPSGPSATIVRGPLRAVVQVGALVAVGGDEHAVEAGLERVQDPGRPDAAGARAGR